MGNAFYEYLRSGILPGATLAKRTSQLFNKLKTHYREFGTHTRLQGLTEEMICRDSKPPKLHAKGAETRGVVPFAVICAKEMSDRTGSVHDLTVYQCLSSLLGFYSLLWLPEWHQDLAKSTVNRFLSLYSALSEESMRLGSDRFWRRKPKFHMFAELTEQASFLGNPMKYWAYLDEDFVGQIARVAFSRGGPKAAATTARKVLTAYRALEGAR